MEEKQVEVIEIEPTAPEKKPGKEKKKRRLTLPKKKTLILGAVGLLVLYVVVSN